MTSGRRTAMPKDHAMNPSPLRRVPVENRLKTKKTSRAVRKWRAPSTKTSGQTPLSETQIHKPAPPRPTQRARPSQMGILPFESAQKQPTRRERPPSAGKIRNATVVRHDAVVHAKKQNGVSCERNREGNDVKNADPPHAEREWRQRGQEERRTDLHEGESSRSQTGVSVPVRKLSLADPIELHHAQESEEETEEPEQRPGIPGTNVKLRKGRQQERCENDCRKLVAVEHVSQMPPESCSREAVNNCVIVVAILNVPAIWTVTSILGDSGGKSTGLAAFPFFRLAWVWYTSLEAHFTPRRSRDIFATTRGPCTCV